MRVYELMSKLSEFPSGAIVKCSATLGVSDLTNGEHLDDDLYAVYKDIDSVENSESESGLVYLNI